MLTTIIILAILALIVFFGRSAFSTGVRNTIRQGADAIGENLADPVRDAEYTLQDARKEVADFRSNIAELIAANNGLQRDKDAAEKAIVKYEKIAVSAGQAGDAASVKEALTLKGVAEAKVTLLGTEVNKNETLEAALREQLDALEAKIAAGEIHKVSLSARSVGARLREKSARSAANASGGRGIAALDALEHAVTKQEGEAEAWEELAATSAAGREGALESKYGAGGKGAISDDDVAKYLPAKA